MEEGRLDIICKEKGGSDTKQAFRSKGRLIHSLKLRQNLPPSYLCMRQGSFQTLVSPSSYPSFTGEFQPPASTTSFDTGLAVYSLCSSPFASQSPVLDTDYQEPKGSESLQKAIDFPSTRVVSKNIGSMIRLIRIYVQASLIFLNYVTLDMFFKPCEPQLPYL